MIEVQTAPVETVTPLRPSEAMRLGRMLYPERCEMNLAERTETGWAVCAVGALLVGLGHPPEDGLAYHWADRALGPRIFTECFAGPCYWDGSKDATLMVAHLNDQHEWDTNRIADWLEGQGL